MRPTFFMIYLIFFMAPHLHAGSQVNQITRDWASGNHQRAYAHAQKILAEDALQIDALVCAGRYATLQMLEMHERGISFEDERRVSWKQQAIEYLVRALNTNPDHRPARLLLSQVYYESQMPERLLGLLESQRQNHPQDPELYFFMCLALQDMGKIGPSYQAFVMGTQYLKDGYLKQSMHFIDSENSLSDPWLSRDPLFLTDVNERLKTHFCRVVYAEMRFGDVTHNVHGFQTDMGEMYVRYGAPLSRLSRMGNRGREEVWAYTDFKLVFQKNNGGWHFAWAQTEELPYMSPDEFKAFKSDQYRDPYGHLRYSIPVQVGQFRDTNGQTRVELFFGLPDDEVKFQKSKQGLARVNVHQGVFLFNSNWHPQMRNTNYVTHMPYLQNKAYDTGLLLWTERLSATPGEHMLGIEAQDQTQASIGSFLGPLTVSDFSGDTLQISTPLLAHRIKAHTKRPYGRARFTILANPSRQFGAQANIATYFEAYNLLPDNNGFAQARIHYAVKSIYSGDKEVDNNWETIGEKTVEHQGDWTANTHEIQGNWLMPGTKAIRVQVEDLISGQVAQAETTFRVAW